MIPSNHRQAERQLISLVVAGEWEIDSAGRISRLRTAQAPTPTSGPTISG